MNPHNRHMPKYSPVMGLTMVMERDRFGVKQWPSGVGVLWVGLNNSLSPVRLEKIVDGLVLRM